MLLLIDYGTSPYLSKIKQKWETKQKKKCCKQKNYNIRNKWEQKKNWYILYKKKELWDHFALRVCLLYKRWNEEWKKKHEYPVTYLLNKEYTHTHI